MVKVRDEWFDRLKAINKSFSGATSNYIHEVKAILERLEMATLNCSRLEEISGFLERIEM